MLNPAYKNNNIKIDESIFLNLPENDIPIDLNTVNGDLCQNADNIIIDNGLFLQENQNEYPESFDEYEAFIETSENETLQIDNIKIAINMPDALKLIKKL